MSVDLALKLLLDMGGCTFCTVRAVRRVGARARVEQDFTWLVLHEAGQRNILPKHLAAYRNLLVFPVVHRVQQRSMGAGRVARTTAFNLPAGG